MPFRILIFTLAGTMIMATVSVFSNLNASIYEDKIYLDLENKQIDLTIVSTGESRAFGLSGRDSLPDDAAMLFVFDEVDKHGIWMKDMKFTIDIIWLDQNENVVHIEENISPDTYPKVFKPKSPAKYVIEGNVGFIEKNNIFIGKTLKFSKK